MEWQKNVKLTRMRSNGIGCKFESCPGSHFKLNDISWLDNSDPLIFCNQSVTRNNLFLIDTYLDPQLIMAAKINKSDTYLIAFVTHELGFL